MKNLDVRKNFLTTAMAGLTVIMGVNIGSTIFKNTRIENVPAKEEFEKISDIPVHGIDNKFLEKLLEEKKLEETTEVEEEIIEVDKDSIEYNTRKEDIVFITNTTYVYGEENTDSDIYGKLLEGRNYRYIGETDEWYNIDYFGFYGYVPKSDGIKVTKDVMVYPPINKGYITEEKKIYADKEMTYELDTLPKLEFVEINRELDNSYLVSTTDNKIGYIDKDNINFIEENLAVVDVSDQVMYLYDGNVRVMSQPVVTGCINNGTISDLGYFTIFLERGVCSFSGVTVNHMLNYNNGEGIHDAFRWRQTKEFGGDTYIANGSHGCINNLLHSADYAAFILDQGDKVLVKE